MPAKLSFEIANQRLVDRGIVLVGEYEGAHTKTKFRCSNGHEWMAKPADVMNGTGCPHCAGNVKLNAEIVNQRIADRGIMLVGEYEGNNAKTKFRCNHGHGWVARPKSVMRGTGCPHCAGNVMLNAEIVNQRIADRGIVLVKEYTRSSTKTKFRCSHGHEWMATPNHVMKGSGCPHCAGNVMLNAEIVNQRIADRGIVLAGNYQSASTKTKFRCSHGHEWMATPGKVMSGDGCPHCAGLAPLNAEIVNQRIADRGIVLAGNYEKALTKTKFRCSHGHEWIATPNDVMRGHGCPHCAGLSPLNAEIVNQRIADRGIMLVGEYEGTNAKTKFRCSHGHEWMAMPSSVMSGTGCPHCANYGFNPAAPAYFYTLISEDGRINVGITNRTIAERKKEHERDDGTTYQLLASRFFTVGKFARELETDVLKKINDLGYLPVQGSREEFYISPDIILSILETEGEYRAAA